MERMKIKRSMIQDETLVCPYCINEVSQDDTGCCGESSAHFETAILTVDGFLFLKTEVKIIEQGTEQGT